MPASHDYIRLALRLARRGLGATSPNPMVGAVLVKRGEIIGRGWHHRAGAPHAEIEALRDAHRRGSTPKGSTLYVTLEPCSTHGRTPPCTAAIIEAGLRKVVVGATDPNPRHRGKGLSILKRAGVDVVRGVLAPDCERLNEAFNHWIAQRTPFVTVKSAMTLDGKIATASGESRWITGGLARAWGMKLRQRSDAILVGINTILADDPSLTFRPATASPLEGRGRSLRRIVLDARARCPLTSKVVTDANAHQTTVVTTNLAPQRRIAALSKRVRVMVAPLSAISQGRHSDAPAARIDLRWLLKQLGSEDVTSLLVEGGGEVNASFLFQDLVHRLVFFYAPRVLGGRDSRAAVAGEGATSLEDAIDLRDVHWRRLGLDWLLTASPRQRRFEQGGRP